MNFKENETEQKLRGGYYTPEIVARFLVQWALSGKAKHVLEPSCGDGSFIDAISVELKTKHIGNGFSVDAVEIIPEESDKAKEKAKRLKGEGINVKIENSDFFLWITNGKVAAEWDVIIGNPPYIRYQYFDKEQRDRAEQIFRIASVPFTKRTNAWVPFIIASVMHLAPGGRLAMVIPSEILHIQHAGGLRLLLEQEMESVAVVNIRDMIFEDALQGIVLLLAIKRDRKTLPLQNGKTSLFDSHSTAQEKKTHLEIIDINGLEHLKDLDIDEIYRTSPARHFHGDWMRALLTNEELELIERITAKSAVKNFIEIASVDIGIVTGANDFFVVDSETQRKYKLEKISSPMLAKSDLIAGITYTLSDHEINAKEGRSVHFLSFPAKPLGELPASMAEYLKLGEAQKLHTRYKCRIREPWYVVPYVWVAELSLLKRCHLYPRIVLNKARALSTDTAYRIKMLPRYENRAKDLTFSFLNSLSFLHAEMLGRHYGGGVLELVPSEIERIPIPLISVSDRNFDKADKLIRNNTALDELVGFTDNLILREALELSQIEIEIIRKAHKRLLNRRLRK